MKIHGIGISYSGRTMVLPHFHQYWELIFNLEGEGTHFLEKEEGSFSPGTIVLCPPKTLHWKKSNQGGYQDAFLLFSGSCAAGELRRWQFQDDSDRTAERLFRMLHSVCHRGEPGWERVAEPLLEALLGLLLLWEGRQGRRPDPQVELLRSRIVDGFTNPAFRIEDAVDGIPYCRDYLRRCFQAELGMTPVEYLQRLRIDHAKKLLQSSSPRRSVGETAYLSGFADPGYFARLFRRLEGVPPSRFRPGLGWEGERGREGDSPKLP